MLRIRLALAVVLCCVVTAAAQEGGAKGTLIGFVVDLGTGGTMHSVEVKIEPGGISATSDLDGMISVDLSPGTYTISVSKEGFIELRIENVQISAEAETFQDVPLQPETGVTSTTIEVVASAEQASSAALLAERKAAGTLSDSIGRQEMSKNSGSDAADLMQRVVGVSIVGDNVFVRGLGDRYSLTTINGAIIPSTQPDKKVIPMDLFPANLLENIKTEKSYTPDQPAEFAGGHVKIRTIDFPRRPTLKLSYGTGGDSITAFRDGFQEYPGGDFDFWGFDDGTRNLPDAIPGDQVERFNRFTGEGLQPEELEALGESFSNVWESGGETAPLDQKFSFTAGNTFGRLGIVAAFNHSIDYHRREEDRTFYRVGGPDGELNVSSDFDIFETSTIAARNSATLNFAYKLTDQHKLSFRNLYTHNSSDESRFFEGFDSDIGSDIRDIRLRFEEEAIYSGQISGEHSLNVLGNSLIEWQVSRSRSTLDIPDHRETLYEFDQASGQFVFAEESLSGFRQFTNLSENLWEPQVSWTTFFFGGGMTGSVKVGALYRSRDRDFVNRRFRFVPRGTQGIDLTGSPNELFSPANIRPDGFELAEETRPTDTYAAKQINRAFFGMLDISFQRWRFIGGARVESDGQRVTTFNNFDRDQPPVEETRLEQSDLLPSINAIYQLNPTMNIRGSFSKTLNRPEFRELSPFDFSAIFGGNTVQGNPDLERATILNYDVRWEWFPSALDLISASFFFKDFDQPIEHVVIPQAQLVSSFRNVESARNFGFELDLRRNLGFLGGDLLERFSVNANYTLTDSDIEIGDDPLLTSTNRALTGQSRHVFNSIFEYADPKYGTVARALWNYTGRRITNAGAIGLPDVFEEGRGELDAVFIHPFGPERKWSLKFSAENLLDEEVKFTQGGLPYRLFKKGRSFSVSVSFSFFGE